MSLQGKVALVTGGSRGIGRAIVLALARAGAAVAINYHRQEGAAAEVLQEVESRGGRGLLCQADVTLPEACEKMIGAVLANFGRIDILINNAGIRRDNLLALLKIEDWETVVDTNLKGVFNCCKAVLRPFLKQKSGGRIINISSVAGITGNSGQTNYAAAKAGVIAFTKSLAKEMGKRGITVNAVAPGMIETDMTTDLPPKLKETVLPQIALQRFGKPEEVAEAVLFLARGAHYITGAVIVVDGGLSL
ncbi:MAG: 3-oxoacyl-[acyl-carrier-protein] reductase [Firmicutes bacterium]|nr:3-oxoacyl-[acyl-carrier-protein] reductase [Bacillota bacterium]